MCGHGCLETLDGATLYQGCFQDNRPHGRGRMLDGSGNLVYKGEFEHGKQHGNGVWYDSKGYRKGGWLAGELSCAKGQSVARHATKPLVCTYVGPFLHNLPIAYGVERVAKAAAAHGTECVPPFDEYEGCFHNGVRHGVGLLRQSGQPAFAGIWWNGELKLVLAEVSAPASLSAFMQSFPSLQPADGLPMALVRPPRHTTGTQTAAEAPEPSRTRLQVSVYSLSTLTNMPRKEFVVHGSQPLQILKHLSKGGTVFFCQGRFMQVDDCTDRDVTIENIATLENEQKAAPIYFVRCSGCMNARGMQPKTGGHHDAFDVLECQNCHLANATAAMYCKLCSTLNSAPCNALFTVEKGVRHLSSVHGVNLGDLHV